MSKSARKESAVVALRSLEDKRAKLLDHAKRELMESIYVHVQELQKLGFDYQLAKGGQSRRQRPARRQAEKFCNICGFKTEPPHDARTHRWYPRKAPFTAAELQKRQLRRID